MNKKGFTLIEMIFAMGLLCIVTVILLRMFVTASEIENKVDVLEMAALEASNAIEDYKVDVVKLKVYFDDAWQVVEEKNTASFERLLYVEKDLKDTRLFSLEVQIWDLKASEMVFSIKTKYYNTKE